MRIHEADFTDKIRWDSFVDNEGGSFEQYFDMKFFYESRGDRFIPIMVEDDSSPLLGILPLVKQKKFLYSFLESLPEGGGGFLIKRDLSESEKIKTICTLVNHVDRYYSKRCSGLSIRENTLYTNDYTKKPDTQHQIPDKALADSGLTYAYNKKNGFPCTHILELKQPFEQHIWRGLWSSKFRSIINKPLKNGVTVIEDKEFKYKDIFIDMLAANYRRHRNKRDIKSETEIRFDIFKNKTKLFIAFLNNQPIVGQLCHYTPSTCYLTKLGSYSRDTGHASKLCIKAAIEDACNSGYSYVDFCESASPNVAEFKSQFGSVRVPKGRYQKTYSVFRNRIYQASELVEILRHDKTYLWRNWKKLWHKLINVRDS